MHNPSPPHHFTRSCSSEISISKPQSQESGHQARMFARVWRISGIVRHTRNPPHLRRWRWRSTKASGHFALAARRKTLRRIFILTRYSTYSVPPRIAGSLECTDCPPTTVHCQTVRLSDYTVCTAVLFRQTGVACLFKRWPVSGGLGSTRAGGHGTEVPELLLACFPRADIQFAATASLCYCCCCCSCCCNTALCVQSYITQIGEAGDELHSTDYRCQLPSADVSISVDFYFGNLTSLIN